MRGMRRRNLISIFFLFENNKSITARLSGILVIHDAREGKRRGNEKEEKENEGCSANDRRGTDSQQLKGSS